MIRSTYSFACLLIVRAAPALSVGLYTIFIVDPHITPAGGLKEECSVFSRATT